MLSPEQYQRTIAHEAFQHMENAVALANSQAQTQQLQGQLGEAMKLIEQQQATIVRQQATIEALQQAAPVLSDAVDTEGGARD